MKEKREEKKTTKCTAYSFSIRFILWGGSTITTNDYEIVLEFKPEFKQKQKNFNSKISKAFENLKDRKTKYFYELSERTKKRVV